MSAVTRKLRLVPPPPPELAADVNCGELGQLQDAMQTSRQRHEGRLLTLSGPEGTEHPELLEAIVDHAVETGAAIALIDPTPPGGSATTLFEDLCTGRAPVISPASAHVLAVLRGRRLAQIQLLEGLLRRHAHHRPILIVVVDATALSPDAAWMLHHLPELLHDSPVTWLYLAPVGRPPLSHVAGAAPALAGRSGPRRPASGVPTSAATPGAEPTTHAVQPTATVTHLPYATVPESRRSAASPGRAERPRFGWEALTQTEIKVTRLIAEGHTNRSAAATLFISVNTVSTHLRSVFTKLDVNSRVQLTRAALPHLSDADDSHEADASPLPIRERRRDR